MLKKRSKSKNNLNMSKESLQGVSLDSVSTAAAANESPVGSGEVLYRNPAYRNRYSLTIVEHVSPQ